MATPIRRSRPKSARKGSIVALAAILLVAVCGILMLSLDLGFLYITRSTRSEAQNAADAAAMAAAWELLDSGRLVDSVSLARVEISARKVARQYISFHRVGGKIVDINTNDSNNPGGQLVFGRYHRGTGLVAFGNARSHNAVYVRVERNAQQNGQVGLFFASVFGIDSAAVDAEAIARLDNTVVGFRPTPATGPSTVIPLTISLDAWQALLSGYGDDNWSFDEGDNDVEGGADGVAEAELFSNSSNGGANAPGNFGTLNIGSHDLGTGDVQGQILEGLTETDLQDFGGELSLDPDTNSLLITGDTGAETPILQAAAEIIGKPVSLPIYEEVTASGQTATYRIVGFAGVRIVRVEIHGAQKRIIVQPAIVVDDSAVSSPNPNDPVAGDFVYRGVRLVK